ncbi:MAG: VWA domain-containing protein [Acidobacteriota bacterium]
MPRFAIDSLVGVLLFGLAIHVPVFATEPVFEDEATVILVEIPVRVIHRGASLSGLTVDDFVLYDRGRERPIATFRAIDSQADVPDADHRQREDARVSVPPIDSTFIDVDATRHHLFLFDLAYAGDGGHARAVEASRELVAAMAPGDSAAISFFSALRGFRVLVDFTSDQTSLDTGIDIVEALLHRDVSLAAEHGSSRTAESTRSSAPLATLDEIQAEAGILVRNDPWWPHKSVIRSFAAGLENIDTWAPDIAGQKHLILYSSGFPQRFLSGNWSADTLGALERAFGTLRRDSWAVQAINVTPRRRKGVESLFYLAVETGGESYENYNDVSEAVAKMLDKTRYTYLIGFYADELGTAGALHKIDVDLVDGPNGARVLHRRGYYAPEPQVENPPRIERSDS